MIIRGELVKREEGKVHFRVGNGNMVIIVDEDSFKGDHIEIPDKDYEENPWLKLAKEVEDKDYFMPRSKGDEVEFFLPAYKTGDHEFVGYRIIADKTGSVKIREIGEYRRVMIQGLEQFEDQLPVVRKRDYNELTIPEKLKLVDFTNPSLLKPLFDYNEKVGVFFLINKLRRDPLSLTQVDKDELKEMLNIALKYWEFASPESNPITIEELIEEMRSEAPAMIPELLYLKSRLLEEQQEDKQVKREINWSKYYLEEYEKELRRREAEKKLKESMEEVKPYLSKVGVNLPIIIEDWMIMKSLETPFPTKEKGKTEKKELMEKQEI